MTDNTPPTSMDASAPALGLDPLSALSVLRSLVGVVTWLNPLHGGRAFGLGRISEDPATAFVARLFGVRDLALGQAVRHPNPEVRRAALQAGVVIDSVDVVAGLIALEEGGAQGGGRDRRRGGGVPRRPGAGGARSVMK